MTRARAAVIYRRDYWDAVRGDDLPSGLDFVAFDAAVNSGVSRSVRWLQAAVEARVDGIAGPQTLAASHAADPAKAIGSATDARMRFLRSLRTWRVFGTGWARRVASVRAASLEMAAASIVPKPDMLARIEALEAKVARLETE